MPDVLNDPTTSYMYGIAKDDPDYEQPHTQSLDSTFSLRQKLSLVVFIAFIGLFYMALLNINGD